MPITEKQLRARARNAQDAEAKLYQAMTWRDAAIAQAATEGRYSNTEIAGMVGVSKARVGRIVRGAWDASREAPMEGSTDTNDGTLYQLLRADLVDLYYRAGHEVLHPDTGKPYWPHAYHHGRGGVGGLTHADDGTIESLVVFVASTVATLTSGADVLGRANRFDLLLETLVLDRTKAYHHLFDADTLANAKRNLEALA